MYPFSLIRIDLKIIIKDISLTKLLKNKIVECYGNIYEMVKCYLFDSQFVFLQVKSLLN